MFSGKHSYLNIWMELPSGKRIKLSLPNRDVSAIEIVRGLIKENYILANGNYEIAYLLDDAQKIYEVAQGENDTFIVHEHRKGNGLNMTIDNKKIFVVHGHEIGLRETVARFLEKLGAEVVFLDEAPGVGLTVIEKLEKYSDVGFAVILMTGDDRGGKKEIKYGDQKLRARQNVIFELGYFLSKLGRSRVCVLYEEGVEIPSDYSGVIYVPYDKSGGWKLKIAVELHAVGLKIDKEKVFS